MHKGKEEQGKPILDLHFVSISTYGSSSHISCHLWTYFEAISYFLLKEGFQVGKDDTKGEGIRRSPEAKWQNNTGEINQLGLQLIHK